MFSKNQKIAQIFYEIADFLEIKGEVFKSRAYQRAGERIEAINEDIQEIAGKGAQELEKIPGVGKSTARKIIEFLQTGKIKEHQRLQKSMPIKVEELFAVEGLGARTIALLYQKLKIKTLKELEGAARKGKLRSLPGFGEKKERNILQSIEFLKKSKEKFLLSEALSLAQDIEKKLARLPEAGQVCTAGSIRRMQAKVGDIDLLVSSQKPEKVMDFFCSLQGVVKIWSKGRTRSSIRLKEGLDVDLRVVDPQAWGAGLQYFTGDKAHNVHLRIVAEKKGYKLNEYGLFKKGKLLASRTEEDLYKSLKMQCPPPEIRQDQGEIEAAQKNRLPKLLKYTDILGDLQVHSDWSDGQHSIEEMAKAGIQQGYQYIAITDHTGSLRIANGLDRNRLLRQMKRIDQLNQQFQKYNFKILKGAEVNITKQGRLDMEDTLLSKLDIVLGAVHSSLKMSSVEMTQRLMRAMHNSSLDIIAHPTGRILNQRPGYKLQLDKLIACSKKNHIILEINAFPTRLDLKGADVRQVVRAGGRMVISTDAHHQEHLQYMKLGIGQARRGWAERKDVINTMQADKLLKFLKKNRLAGRVS